MCFNAELYTLYNSCEGLARAFLERINTADAICKNCVILTHVHSFTRQPHKQKKDMRQKLSTSPLVMFQRPLITAELRSNQCPKWDIWCQNSNRLAGYAKFRLIALSASSSSTIPVLINVYCASVLYMVRGRTVWKLLFIVLFLNFSMYIQCMPSFTLSISPHRREWGKWHCARLAAKHRSTSLVNKT